MWRTAAHDPRVNGSFRALPGAICSRKFPDTDGAHP